MNKHALHMLGLLLSVSLCAAEEKKSPPEQPGVSGEVTVRLPKGVKVSKMTPVNLRGEPAGNSRRIWFGRFKVDLKAFAPASFVLE